MMKEGKPKGKWNGHWNQGPENRGPETPKYAEKETRPGIGATEGKRIRGQEPPFSFLGFFYFYFLFIYIMIFTILLSIKSTKVINIKK